MTSDTAEAVAALTLPTLAGHQAKRHPSLKGSIGFLKAIESKTSALVQLEASRELLLGMGFPEAAVDELDPAEAVEQATNFFLASLQRNRTSP